MISLFLRGRRVLPWVVAFELVVSAVLAWLGVVTYQDQTRTAHNVVAISKVQQVSSCWDHVLNQAIQVPPATPRARLIAEARQCAAIKGVRP